MQLADTTYKLQIQNGQLVTYLPKPVLNTATGAEYDTLSAAVQEASKEDVLPEA